jgi:hypothetical protein
MVGEEATAAVALSGSHHVVRMMQLSPLLLLVTMVHRDSVYRLPRRRLELLRIRKAAVGVVVGVGGTGAPSREHIGVTQ